MKDLPRHLTIGETDYCIVFTPDIKKSLAGSCDQHRKAILVAMDQDRREIMATFWHEILHAIEREFDVKLGHKRINKLEHALAQVHSQLRNI